MDKATIFSHLQNLTDPPVTQIPPIGTAMGLTGGGDDPNPMAKEMRSLSSRKMMFDNLPASVVAMNAAKKAGVSPSFLYASAFGEGLNKAIAHPDMVSEAYLQHEKDLNGYPVDGFYNYGLDTFGAQFPDLVKKGYLPQEFSSQFKAYPAKNEAENVTTAAFKNNEAALMAKAAMMRDRMDTVKAKAKAKGVDLDDEGAQYLTLASYNGKAKSADTLFNEYLSAKDKKAFIEKGLTSMKGIHKNIYPRLQNMRIADEIFNQK